MSDILGVAVFFMANLLGQVDQQPLLNDKHNIGKYPEEADVCLLVFAYLLYALLKPEKF